MKEFFSNIIAVVNNSLTNVFNAYGNNILDMRLAGNTADEVFFAEIIHELYNKHH